MKIEIKENERIDDLDYKGLQIIQNKDGFCFGMDAVVLSDFAKEIKAEANVLDLGTGTGIISILLCEKSKLSKIYGVEVQGEVAQMAKRSSKLNELEDKFEIVHQNIKELESVFPKGSFDAVVTNPPYKKENTGIINESKTKVIARHEVSANLEDFIRIASSMLKQRGEFYMVHRPERLADIMELLRKYKLEPKVVKVVYPKVSKEANLILVKATKEGKPFLKIEEPLVIYHEDGTYTKAALKVYHKE